MKPLFIRSHFFEKLHFRGAWHRKCCTHFLAGFYCSPTPGSFLLDARSWKAFSTSHVNQTWPWFYIWLPTDMQFRVFSKILNWSEVKTFLVENGILWKIVGSLRGDEMGALWPGHTLGSHWYWACFGVVSRSGHAISISFVRLLNPYLPGGAVLLSSSSYGFFFVTQLVAVASLFFLCVSTVNLPRSFGKCCHYLRWSAATLRWHDYDVAICATFFFQLLSWDQGEALQLDFSYIMFHVLWYY